MFDCIDLKKHFGSHYRVTYEPSYAAERGEGGRRYDPWLLTIPCQHGNIYPHGGELLGASTNKRGAIAKRLTALPCVRVVQDGDDGVNAVFDIADFDAVAAILKARRCRKLSPAHRAKLAAAGKQALARYRSFSTILRPVDAVRGPRLNRKPPETAITYPSPKQGLTIAIRSGKEFVRFPFLTTQQEK